MRSFIEHEMCLRLQGEGFSCLYQDLNPGPAVNTISVLLTNTLSYCLYGGCWEEPRQSTEYLGLVLENGKEKQTQEASHGWPLGRGRNPIYGITEFTNIRVFQDHQSRHSKWFHLLCSFR